MKKYYDTIIISDYDEEYGLIICELSMSDVLLAEKELNFYMQKQGKLYERDTNKKPYLKNFFNLYFGEEEYDIYCGTYYVVPNRYVCVNKEVADRFMGMAKRLAYHDKYNQVYCDVVQDGKIIDIIYGEY